MCYKAFRLSNKCHTGATACIDDWVTMDTGLKSLCVVTTTLLADFTLHNAVFVLVCLWNVQQFTLHNSTSLIYVVLLAKSTSASLADSHVIPAFGLSLTPTGFNKVKVIFFYNRCLESYHCSTVFIARKKGHSIDSMPWIISQRHISKGWWWMWIIKQHKTAAPCKADT